MQSCFVLDEFTAMMTDKRSQCIAMAKIAEQAERYEGNVWRNVVLKDVWVLKKLTNTISDMCAFMKCLVEGTTPADLNEEERNLLSVAYKFVIGRR